MNELTAKSIPQHQTIDLTSPIKKYLKPISKLLTLNLINSN